MDLCIKGKKFIHLVNVIQKLKENIIGIDFIHAHYDNIAPQVKFAGARTNSIMALKKVVLPASHKSQYEEHVLFGLNQIYY